jgi:hypothetical protein
VQLRQEPSPQLHVSLVHRLTDILFRRDFEFAELHSALAMLGWGLWVLNPFWDTFGSSISFRVMAAVAAEVAWGCGMTGLGIAQLVVLLMRSRTGRRVAAGIASITWLCISILLMLGNITSTASVIYPLLACSAGWSYLRLSVPDQSSDEQ